MDEVLLFKARVSSVATKDKYEDGASVPDFDSYSSIIRFTTKGAALEEHYHYKWVAGGADQKTVNGYHVPAKLDIGEEYELVLRKVTKPLMADSNNRVFQDDEYVGQKLDNIFGDL